MTHLLTPTISPSALSVEWLKHTISNQPNNTVQPTNDPARASFERIKELTGIVPSHLMPLQHIAATTNTIIGIRPVENVATGLIEAGHPTKDFHIKGKSANWGPQAGLICTNQSFSKLEKFAKDAPGKVTQANEQVQDCINEGHAVAIPLTVSRQRLGELIDLGLLTQLAPSERHGALRFSALAPTQQLYTFEAKRISSSGENYLITHDGKPVEVLAKSQDGKPITADYDLHIVAPHLSDFGSQDKIPVPDVAHRVFKSRVDQYKQRHTGTRPYQVPAPLRADYESASHFYQKEHPDLGNATPRIKHMIELINNKLVGNGERVVHHNADSGSPATDEAANYPATFFLPTKLGEFDKICIIRDNKEMANFIKTAKNSGYHVPLNPLWEGEVSSIKRSSFTHAHSRLASAFRHG